MHLILLTTPKILSDWHFGQIMLVLRGWQKGWEQAGLRDWESG